MTVSDLVRKLVELDNSAGTVMVSVGDAEYEIDKLTVDPDEGVVWITADEADEDL